MKANIGLPLGLALVMFIGIFATVLALGALNPQPAEAAITADFAVTLSDSEAEAQSDWSFSIVSTVDFAAGNTMTVEFPAGFDITGSGVTTAANWSLGDAAPASAAVLNQVVTLTAAAGMTTITGSTATTPTSIPVSFTAPDLDDDPDTNDNGIVNPSYDDAPVDLVPKVDTGNTGDDEVESGTIHIIDSTIDGLTVTNNPTDLGAASRYQIRFVTEYELSEGTDEIVLDLDSAMGVPTSLGLQDVRISATAVTGVGSTANQSRPLEYAPLYRVLPGTENRKEYTISIPDMDASPDRNASIAAGATVTLTLLASAGFTNPTESGTDWINVSTSRQTQPVRGDFFTPVVLFSSDLSGNRNTPLIVRGLGFKNGTSATVYIDQNKNGLRDAGDTDLVVVPVTSSDTFEAIYLVTVPPFAPLPTRNVINAVDGQTPPNTLSWEGFCPLTPMRSVLPSLPPLARLCSR